MLSWKEISPLFKGQTMELFSSGRWRLYRPKQKVVVLMSIPPKLCSTCLELFHACLTVGPIQLFISFYKVKNSMFGVIGLVWNVSCKPFRHNFLIWSSGSLAIFLQMNQWEVLGLNVASLRQTVDSVYALYFKYRAFLVSLRSFQVV